MSPCDSDRSRELQRLLEAMRPQIVEMLQEYRVPEERAAEIVHDTFIALALRWNRVGDRETWLIGTLRARCEALGSSERGGS